MSRIWDCMMFSGEVDLLEVRLRYLAPVVDTFVIVEADHNHAGRPVEPVFLKNAERFAEFPIEYVLVTDLPTGPDNWQRVWFHRNAMLRGITDAEPHDIVLTSDLDEIPAYDYVESFKHMTIGQGMVEVCEMDMFYYQPTIKSTEKWTGTRACCADTLRLLTPQRVRHRSDTLMRNTGWHFSYFGGAEAIQKKIESIAESAHLAIPEYTDLDKIKARVAAAADLYDRADQSWQRVPLDPTMPPGIEQFIWAEEVPAP